MVDDIMLSSPSVPNRPASTDAVIINAFVALTFERRYAAIRIADLIARAGVGKSTFYEHFRGKDAVLLAAMQPILLALATAASGRAARSYVRDVVGHLWDRRSTGRAIMDSTAAPILHRQLANAIATHGGRAGADEAVPIAAIGIAGAQLAMLSAWLAGQAPATIDAMTDGLMACSRLWYGDAAS
ncbi:MAG: helix-turn-helix domain containing protein [Sphingomonas bacterium]|nr:helix-turn-helix domain containing protein [Sphingomonas bacterium]